MRLSVYIPKELEKQLAEAASDSGMSIPKFIQALVRQRLEERPRRFSGEFLELAGSWEDGRSSDEILRDLRESRVPSERVPLR